MRTVNITISSESRLLWTFLVSGALLIALVWRMLKRGEDLLSARVGLACCFVSLAILAVWGTQRAAGQRWSWLAVLLAVCESAVAPVWLAFSIMSAVCRAGCAGRSYRGDVGRPAQPTLHG